MNWRHFDTDTEPPMDESYVGSIRKIWAQRNWALIVHLGVDVLILSERVLELSWKPNWLFFQFILLRNNDNIIPFSFYSWWFIVYSLCAVTTHPTCSLKESNQGTTILHYSSPSATCSLQHLSAHLKCFCLKEIIGLTCFNPSCPLTLFAMTLNWALHTRCLLKDNCDLW